MVFGLLEQKSHNPLHLCDSDHTICSICVKIVVGRIFYTYVCIYLYSSL